MFKLQLLGLTKRYRGAAILSLGIFGVSSTAQGTRAKSSHVFRTPPSSAPRAVPTPLVFVSSRTWDSASHAGVMQSASMFAERGYMCLEVDIDPPDSEAEAKTMESVMRFYESELAQQIRLTGIPFPPVIIARSSAALIAQQYISSNPASGLVLISPPPSNATLSQETRFGTGPLREFDFEPRFPVVIVELSDREDIQRKENRLVRDEGVGMIVVKDIESQDALVKIEQWLDQQGI